MTPVQSRRQIIVERGAFCSALSAATRYVIGRNDGTPSIAGANPGSGLFYLEPDDYIGTKLRVRVISLTNATAPVSDYIVSMHPVTAVAGGAAAVTITPGTAIAASQITITAPGISSMIQQVTPEFDWPAAGYYTMSVLASATAAANSCVQLTMQLEAR